MAESIIIRVQSPDGVKRITTTKRETAATFLKKVAKEFGFQNNGFSVYINRNKTGEITASSSKSLHLLKIKHGDLLFLFPSSLAGPSSEMETSASLGLKAFGAPNVVEDEIDQYLSKQDGKIYRSRDPQLCRHGPLGKCVHCVPLEPFDEDYLNHLEPPVKHMSFHAYIRKLTGGADKGKFVALENISCKIKSGCEGHLPWPNGICTKCQPSAITLNRQKYRHVDNIMFENHTVADRFLDFWRKTGNQHFGYLYGRYTEHKDIPLGIRAEVAAIYEPPQIGTQNSLELLEDPKAEVVDEIAAKLGLRKVGWIFTDLVSEDTRKGTVRYSRNKDTYFLSSEECITAGDFQNKHPNICRLSPDGHFGSKFVTAVATGGPDNQVHFEGYQVSNQCMALVRDECLLPCKDAPELGYAKESSSEQYVPDVFYKDIDKFGNEITQLARPGAMAEKVLVTGGAGYIGSHTVLELLEAGYSPVVIDNFHNAIRGGNSMPESLRRVQELTGRSVEFEEMDILDQAALQHLFKKHSFKAVIHFAGLKAVGESVQKPLDYYRVNLTGTIQLLEIMRAHGVKNLVFSSSATVYGNPQYLPLDEAHPTGGCTNPYGKSKFFIEEMIRDLCRADSAWNAVLLRYFNPTGAHASGCIGEDPQGIPNNLMPYVSQVAIGRREALNVFGDDYATEDGTGVRDYIHVVDLAKGHIAALKKLEEQCGCRIYNLGTGTGYSVLQMVQAMEKASGKKIPYKVVARREGDVAACYANPSLAHEELGWTAALGLDRMCEDLWRWQKQNPSGFGAQA